MTPEIPPDGFQYYGIGPLPQLHDKGVEPDIAMFHNNTWEISGEYVGKLGNRHYALRIGSPIHALNFPKPMTHRPHDLPSELPDPPTPPEEMMWVYSGYLYKSESRKYRAWIHDGKIYWHSGANSRASENPCHYLEAVPINQAKPEPAKAREWWAYYDPSKQKHIALEVGLYDSRQNLSYESTKHLSELHMIEILPEISSPGSAEEMTADPKTWPKDVVDSVFQDAPCPPHYAGTVTPWDLQRCMKSSGNTFVDARRTDAIEYCFRDKEDILADLRKAESCIHAAIEELEKQTRQSHESL